jgi:hypothetical protein
MEKYKITLVDPSDEDYKYVTEEVYDTNYEANIAYYHGAVFYRFDRTITNPNYAYGSLYFGQYKGGQFFLALENQDWLTYDLKEIIDAMIKFYSNDNAN